jgi:hypothetical protein
VVDATDIREEYGPPDRGPGRHVCTLSMVFPLERGRAPDYLRVMPQAGVERLERIRGEIRRLQAEADDLLNEEWRRAKPYTVPKP